MLYTYGWIGMVVFFFARKQQRRLLLVVSWCPGDVVGQGLVARLYYLLKAKLKCCQRGYYNFFSTAALSRFLFPLCSRHIPNRKSKYQDVFSPYPSKTLHRIGAFWRVIWWELHFRFCVGLQETSQWQSFIVLLLSLPRCHLLQGLMQS